MVFNPIGPVRAKVTCSPLFSCQRATRMSPFFVRPLGSRELDIREQEPLCTTMDCSADSTGASAEYRLYYNNTSGRFSFSSWRRGPTHSLQQGDRGEQPLYTSQGKPQSFHCSRPTIFTFTFPSPYQTHQDSHSLKT